MLKTTADKQMQQYF